MRTILPRAESMNENMLFVELHQAQFDVRNCLVPPGFYILYNKISLLGLLTFDSAYYLIFVTERMGLFIPEPGIRPPRPF